MPAKKKNTIETEKADRKIRSELLTLRKRIDDLARIEQERSEAEKALRESEAKYRGLFENILEGVYQTRPDGKIMSANPALVKMLGYKTEEELIKEASAKSLYVDPKERKALLKKLNKEEVLRDVEFSLRRKDGKEICVLENARVVWDTDRKNYHYEGVLTDITNRKKTERDLQKAHERLEATLDTLPDLFFLVDKKGKILDFRAPQPEMLALHPEDFLGKTVNETLPREAAAIIMNSIKRASQKGKHFGSIYSLKLPEGTGWFELSIAVQGNPRRKDCTFVALVRNITERKKNEDKLREQAEQLKEERKALSDKNIALKQILEQISTQRQEIQAKLYSDFETSVLPLLARLKKRIANTHAGDVDSIVSTIEAVLARDSDDYRRKYARLSSRESEICDYIRDGLSTKEIAELLSISELTIAKHREKIRRKLGLAGRNISLATYLRSHK